MEDINSQSMLTMLHSELKHKYHKQKHREALLEASRETGLEVNTENTKCMVESQHQNTRTKSQQLTANKSLEQVAMS
jgi:hypothetical protein